VPFLCECVQSASCTAAPACWGNFPADRRKKLVAPQALEELQAQGMQRANLPSTLTLDNPHPKWRLRTSTGA